MFIHSINCLKKISFLILLATACGYKEKIDANRKASNSYTAQNNQNFVAQCSRSEQSDPIKNTFAILKKISNNNECDATFRTINDLKILDFGIPKPGEENTVDLSPLKDFEHLRRINIQYRTLSDPKQLSQFINLERLILNHTNLDNIDFLAPLSQLAYVDLSHNKIQNLDGLKGLTKVTDLWLKDNRITKVSVLADLTSLQYLDLAKNQISDIAPLARLDNLKWIFLEDNPLTDLSALYNITSLESLSYDEKKVSKLPDPLKTKTLKL